LKLQRTTWILVAIAAILGSAVYLGEIRGRAWREAAQARQRRVFDVAAEAIEQITIEPREGDVLHFERSAEEPAAWELTEPVAGRANEAAIAFLLDQLVDAQQEGAFAIQRRDRADYGFDEPAASLEIRVAARDEPYELVLGRTNFDERLVYALVNPPAASADELQVVLLPIDLKYAVERKLNEWLQESDADTADDPEADEPDAADLDAGTDADN